MSQIYSAGMDEVAAVEEFEMKWKVRKDMVLKYGLHLRKKKKWIARKRVHCTGISEPWDVYTQCNRSECHIYAENMHTLS